MFNLKDDVYLYIKQVISHSSVFWPNYCYMFDCEDVEFCEYLRGAEGELMAKTKCTICKAFNARSEAAKHPNAVTFVVFTKLMSKLYTRDPEAIASICEEHRNPLKFNVCMIELGDQKKIDLLSECAHKGVPVKAVAPNITI